MMDKFERRYKLLNKEQREAVDTIEGPVLVIAGPGSGKTEVLGLRVANILRKTDVSPGNILCLTFTDSAAVNMRERLREFLGQEAYKVAIHTFHNFGVGIINYHPEIFYKGAVFTSADELTQLNLLSEIFSNLEYDNPLGETHPEQGYTYLRPAQKAIQYLKRAGLTPDEFENILNHNEKSLRFLNPLLSKFFEERVKKEMFKSLPEVIERIKKHEEDSFPVEHMESLISVTVGSLERAFLRAKESDSTRPFSEWRRERMYRNEKGEQVLKETRYLEKMRALARIYKEYRKLMYEKGYYDFDDMILDTVTAIERNDELRYELQEQFQYILVDEFQDTNDAQMRILILLTSAEVHEGRPNIMAVGDDDQAIFRFQGAEVSNISKFKDLYRDPKIITMVKNYRSRQDILDVARYVITQGSERLENIIPQVNKVLESANDKIAEGEIVSKSFPTKYHEYSWVAKEIKRLIDRGLEPREIGVIARRHENLKSLVPYLNSLEIPISYESQRDVLQEPHIRQLIQMGRFAVYLLKKERENADSLLPEILSYPFWGIDRRTIWEISKKAYENREPWLDVMLSFEDGKIRKIADFLLDLSASAEYDPVDRVLDKMVGAKTHILPESEDEEMEESSLEEDTFISPFRDYYFSKEEFKRNPARYLTFLSGLRTFIYALREYRQGQIIGLQDMIDFVKMHEDNQMVLSDNSVLIQGWDAVNLLTAHKAKGMEFDTVFVLNCEDNIWAGRKKGFPLPFPSNLPIAPAGDSRDDQLRLFYVAITRAARALYLTSYELDDAGKEVPRLQFISPPVEEKSEKIKKALQPEAYDKKESQPKGEEPFPVPLWRSSRPPFLKDEKILLRSMLENYKLNVTHLNNFLNVADGGPQLFLEQNLLRFPQPKSVSLSYGTAMHETVRKIYEHLKKTGKLPKEDDIIKWFGKFLESERLSERDLNFYFKRGKMALKVFFRNKKDEFRAEDLSEFNFREEGVVIEDVPITGEIDKMEFRGKEIVVYDFKTGKFAERWKGKDKHENIKLWKYKNQLVFYKILIENSRRFGGNYEVRKGVIEFLEPKDKRKIISLPLVVKDEEVERLKKLIKVVYKKIMDLDFPEIAKYPKNIRGIRQFEEDLIGL